MLGGSPLQDVQPRELHPRRALRPNGSPSPAVTPNYDVDPSLLSHRRRAQQPTEIHRARRKYPPI
jgi:hypothetical protein